MFEQMYTRLFRLYPSRFRKEYEGVALQLIRDRLRDETGFLNRARLWWDLVADALSGLLQVYRNSYVVTEAASLSPNVDGIPSFKVLDEEPLGRGSILIGGTLSLVGIIAFGLLLSRSGGHLPVPSSNRRLSPIESVMERLNRATSPDASMGLAEEVPKSTSMGANEGQPPPSPPSAATRAKSDASTLLSKSRNGVGGQSQTVSTPTDNPSTPKQNPNERLPYLEKAPPSAVVPSNAPALLPKSRNGVGGQNKTVSSSMQNRKESTPYLEKAPSPSAVLPEDAKQRGSITSGNTMKSIASEASAWTGTLTDAFGRPVRSGEIRLVGAHGEVAVARTAENGRFAFAELPSSNYEVVVLEGGREVAHQTLYLSTTSAPRRLTLASGNSLLLSRSGK
jgi:hypothetical protein